MRIREQTDFVKGLLRRLPIQSSEHVLVIQSSVLAFLVGCAHCYLSAVPISLFLIHFSSTSLPQVYLSVAGFVLLFGSFYTWFEYRFPFHRLMFGLFLFIACVTTFFWMILAHVEKDWIIALLTVWALAAYDLLDLGLWSVLNHVFNLQQGKRLFGFIGASQSIGGILAGMMLPALLLFISTEKVLLVTGLLLFISLTIMVRLLYSHSRINTEEALYEENIDLNVGIRQIRGNNYVLKLMSLIFLGVFVMEIVDILFNTIAREHYQNTVALAGFIGVIFALVDAVDLAISAFLFNRILKTYGVIVSLLLLPIIIIMISVLMLVSQLTPLAVVLIFWFIVLLKLFEESVRASVFDISILLLLQPLSPSIRSFVLSKNDTFIVPVATIFISLLLMAITNRFGIIIPWFVVAMLICVGISVLIVLTLKRDYFTMLLNAIKKPLVTVSNFKEVNQAILASLPLFRHMLFGSDPGQVVYAFSNIEQIDQAEAISHLEELLKSKDNLIREFVLQKIQYYHRTEFYYQIQMMLQLESDTSVKVHALMVLADLNYIMTKPIIKQFLRDESPDVAAAALIASYRYGNEMAKKRTMSYLRRMVRSGLESMQITSAFIIGELNDAESNRLLPWLLASPNKRVQREVFSAVIKVGQTECYSTLLQSLDQVSFQVDGLKRFLSLLPGMIPMIKDNFKYYSSAVQIKLLHFMGHKPVHVVSVFLEDIVLSYQGMIQLEALRSLAHSTESHTPEFIKKIHLKIVEEMRCLDQLRSDLTHVPVQEVTELFRDILGRKMALSLERFLLYIALYYQSKHMNKVKVGLLLGNTNDISYAIELLEGILNREHKKNLLPFLRTLFFTETHLGSHLTLHSEEFIKLLKKHLKLPDEDNLTILMCLSCLYIIKTIGVDQFASELASLKNAKSSVIQETLTWVFSNRAERNITDKNGNFPGKSS